jgi:hypothetical protein
MSTQQAKDLELAIELYKRAMGTHAVGGILSAVQRSVNSGSKDNKFVEPLKLCELYTEEIIRRLILSGVLRLPNNAELTAHLARFRD